MTDVDVSLYALELISGSLTQGTPGSLPFRLTRANTPQANITVTFANNLDIIGLPASVTTDGNGEFTLNTLTALKPAPTQIITASVGAQAMDVPISVTAGAYRIEAAPNHLTQGTAADVTFTFTRNGLTVPSGTAVTFRPNSAFNNLLTGGSTDANGQITVNGLTVLANSNQTIIATIDSEIVGVTISVAAGTYTLEAAPSTMKQGDATNVLFTFKVNGTPMPNRPVTFAANSGFTGLPAAATTNANGQVAVNSLTVTAYTDQTINATIDGQAVNVAITVTPIVFSLGEIRKDGGGNFTKLSLTCPLETNPAEMIV